MPFSRAYILRYWSLVVAITCVYFYVSKQKEFESSVKTEATVIGYLTGKTSRGSEYRYPQFRFSYDGGNYRFSEKVSGYQEGDIATVIFPKFTPEKAKVYTFFSYWINLKGLVVILAAAFFLFYLPVFLKSLRQS